MTLINDPDRSANTILEAEITSLLKVNPGWFIGCGSILLILGLLALTFPIFLTLASTVVLGILLIIGGVAQLVMGFAHSASYYLTHRTPRWETILTGACLLIGGLLMCVEPASGAMFITAFLGGLFVFSGIGQIFVAIHSRHAPGYFWILFGGIITSLLGVLLFIDLPLASMQFLGILIALELLMLGFVALFYGLSLRNLHKQSTDNSTYLL